MTDKDAVRECAERIAKEILDRNMFGDDKEYRFAVEYIATELRALVGELCAYAHHEGVTDTISAAVDAAIKAEDEQKADTMEARLVRLGSRTIHLIHLIEGCKWKWVCHVREAHTMDWYRYVADTPSEAVAAAERGVDGD